MCGKIWVFVVVALLAFSVAESARYSPRKGRAPSPLSPFRGHVSDEEVSKRYADLGEIDPEEEGSDSGLGPLESVDQEAQSLSVHKGPVGSRRASSQTGRAQSKFTVEEEMALSGHTDMEHNSKSAEKQPVVMTEARVEKPVEERRNDLRVNIVFPDTGDTLSKAFHVTPLPEYRHSEVVEYVNYWLQDYKFGNVTRWIHNVVVFESIFEGEGEGRPLGGVVDVKASPHTMTIALDGINDQDGFSALAHHEAAHLLEYNLKTNDKESTFIERWNSLMEGDPQFLYKGHSCSFCNRHPSPDLWYMGFYTSYSSISQAEDVAILAQAMWMGDPLLKGAHQQAIILRKMQLIVELYQEMDNNYNFLFFVDRLSVDEEPESDTANPGVYGGNSFNVPLLPDWENIPA